MFPICQEIDYQDPIKIYELFCDDDLNIFFDSANNSTLFAEINRYSYIALYPFSTYTVKNFELLETKEILKDPFVFLKNIMNSFKLEKLPDLPPFQGGLAGYFSYDICHYLEDIEYPKIDDSNFPDIVVGLYNVVVAFDHKKKKCWIFSCGFPATSHLERLYYARAQIRHVISVIKKGNKQSRKFEIDKPIRITSNFNEDNYVNMVNIAKNYIRQGDIFEVNLSQRFKAELPDNLDLFSLYKNLRTVNPAPFAAFMKFNDKAILSASPERFICVSENAVETRPIKGTCKRSSAPEEDKKMASQLQSSIKDRAENVMIVDLMRNDLSRVCKDDSVVVQTLCGLETYATVHHLVSVINGELQHAQSSLDLLAASLPGGSITGAPKVRAMEIISELEPNQRGPYCGSMGFISFNGDMDTSIIIRTYTVSGSIVTYQSGGAIVLDSDALLEYQETLDKVYALTNLLRTG